MTKSDPPAVEPAVDVPFSGKVAAGSLRPAIWWLLSIVFALYPIGDRRAADPPWGRPWYLGRGLTILVVFVTLLVLAARRDRLPISTQRWRRCAAATLFLTSFLAFVSNFGVLTSDDNLPNRALPLAIADGDGFDLSHLLTPELDLHYSILHRGRRSLSAFPLGTGLLVTPYYAAVRALRSYSVPVILADGRFEKHAAALLTAAAVALLFSASAPLFGASVSLLLGLGLALATPAFSTLSQGLWSQTGELAAFAAALALFSAAEDRAERALPATGAGAALGYAVFCRPTALLLLPLVWVWIGPRPAQRRRFVIGLTAAGVAIGLLNWHLYGSISGGYGQLNQGAFELMERNFWTRLWLVLTSPSRGLLWFFPALVFALVRLRAVPPKRLPRPYRLAALSSLLALVMMTAAYAKWWGGYGIGPRLLAEASFPAMLLIAAVAACDRRLWARAVIIALLVCQAVVQVTLTRSPVAIAWNRTVNVDHNPEALRSWRNSLLAAAFVPGWSYEEPGPYLHDKLSSLDAAHRFPLDLAPIADQRYDVEDGTLDERSFGKPYLPRLARLDPAVRNGGPFLFLPPDAANMVRVCTGETSPPVLLPGAAIDRIFTVIAWREPRLQRVDTTRAGNKPPVGGTVVLVTQAGVRRRFPLRVQHELFDTTIRDWARYPAAERYVAGRPGNVDALLTQELVVQGRVRRFHELYLEGPADSPRGCLYLLAVTLRTLSPVGAPTTAR